MNILVTGGSSGLGKAITQKLAEDKGNRVYFTYHKSVGSAKEISSRCANSIGIKCDFCNKDDVKSLVSQIAEMHLEVLVNNAYSGAFLKGHFHKVSSSDFLAEFEKNLIPTIEIAQAAISLFRKKRQGKIITVLTAALLDIPPVGASMYVANKAYLEKLTKVWASENAKYNISSNSVSPSFMQTALTSDTDERIIEQMLNEHPLKRLLTVEEVAETVLFLTKASPQLNGVDIVMNAAMNIE
ncbi:3-oxoacyl-[acyl-carrier protein] reductase [Candidatus Symbiothrix dinenymphae]|nr:3-oxoacyl-[acyl-carrier protein] reductase [Candidatus Symbiothrix dinenymphae]